MSAVRAKVSVPPVTATELGTLLAPGAELVTGADVIGVGVAAEPQAAATIDRVTASPRLVNQAPIGPGACVRCIVSPPS